MQIEIMTFDVFKYRLGATIPNKDTEKLSWIPEAVILYATKSFRYEEYLLSTGITYHYGDLYEFLYFLSMADAVQFKLAMM